MKPILYTLFALILFTTCRKNYSKPADQHFYYYLTKEQLNKTPYFTNPAFDTLTYISNLNDTLVFAKTKTDTLWYISSVFDPGGNDADKYYHYQQLRNSYATIKGEGKFEVLHGKYFIGFDRGLKDLLSFDFDANNFFIQDFFLGVNHKVIIDSVLVRDKIYYQVSEIFRNWQDSTVARTYVNLEFGAFHFIDIKNNKTWTLIK
jgi:hypothetical protein